MPTLPTMKIQTEVTDELKLIFLSAPLSIYLLMASDFKSRLQLLGSEITGFTQDKLYSGFSFMKWYESTKLESECYAKSGSTLVWSVALLFY